MGKTKISLQQICHTRQFKDLVKTDFMEEAFVFQITAQKETFTHGRLNS